MNAHLLLRLVIYGLGLHALSSGLTQFVYYLHNVLDSFSGWRYAGEIFGFVVTPLMLAFIALGFGKRIAKVLLGPEVRVHDSAPIGASRDLLILLLRVAGVFVFATTIGHAIATIFEFIAIKAGNIHFREEQVLTDGMAHLVSLAVAFVLVVQTKRVVSWLEAQEKDAQPPPS